MHLSISAFYIWPFFRWTWVSWYQSVSILDFNGAKGDGSGGNNWSYKNCIAPFKMSPPANQQSAYYRPDALPVAQPAVSEH